MILVKYLHFASFQKIIMDNISFEDFGDFPDDEFEDLSQSQSQSNGSEYDPGQESGQGSASQDINSQVIKADY